jgi:hypothetical protein
MATKKKTGQKTGSMHIDKRAKRLLADPLSEGADDDLLTTRQVADWIQYSTQSLEIMRGKGSGPLFVRVTPKVIRYRREAVRVWLRRRECNSTADYKRPRG